MNTASFDFHLWLAALPVLVAAATVTWLLSLPLRNVSIVDALWSLMLFAAGVIYGLGADPRAPRLAFLLWLVVIWAFRLSIYITARNLGKGEDHRYQAIRARNQPNFGLNFYVLNARGDYAGVAMYESTYAVCTENGAQTLKTDALYPGSATD